MARPATHEDLDEYTRKGHVVAKIPSTYITRFPSLGQHLLAALAEAERLGLAIEDDDIVIEKTDAELDTALASAQSGWDRLRKDYEAAAAGEFFEKWRHNSLNYWAKAEGLPVLVWDKETGTATLPSATEAVA